MEAKVKFPNIYGNGVFFRVCSLEARDAVLAVKCNWADGLTVEGPDQQNIWWSNGHDYGWHVYKLTYTAQTKMYEVFVDGVSKGTYNAVGYRADYIVVGNSVARQGIPGDWTEVEVDYVDVTGTVEIFEIPDWAGPMYLYDPIGYDNELWAYLPLWERGHIEMHKKNTADALSIDLVNFSHGFDPNDPDPAYMVYTNFNFANRPIKVESRVSDGWNWTAWRLIFLGGCDEKNIELRENGDCVLTVSARDIYRRQLMGMHLIRSYSKDAKDVNGNDIIIEGLTVGLSVGQIIDDISKNGAGLPYAAMAVTATPYNIPQTFNVAGDSAASAIEKLISDVAMCWWPDVTNNFQIQVRDWYWGTGTPCYYLSTKEEVGLVQWSENAMDALAILELGIENTEFQNGGFSTNYPHAPVPFYGRVEYESAVVAQDTASLRGRPIHFLKWKQINREVGSIVVTMQCQDWLAHDMELSVRDDIYLGIKTEHGPWIVDGWSYDWEGTSKFETQAHLVNEYPDRVIKRSLQGQV